MRRIVSKIDYDMHVLGNQDPKLALSLWYRICKNKSIIRQAIKVIEQENGETCVYAPAICHMILSNPWDIDKDIYEKFVLTLLKNPELNKLSVFRESTFLYLILLNGALGFDDLYLELSQNGIRKNANDKPFEMRKVFYRECNALDDVEMYYKTGDLEVKMSSKEVEHFSSQEVFKVITEQSTAEIANLVELVEMLPTLDPKIVMNINYLQQILANEQKRTLKK